MTGAAPGRARQVSIPPETMNRVRAKMFSVISTGLKVDHPSLEEYFKAIWPIIEPNNPLIDVWYIGYLAEHLEAVRLRQIKRLAISIHPRSLKSDLISIAWPTHLWIEQPWHRFMFGSYAQELSVAHSLARRRIIESAYYQERWGSIFQIMPDQNRKNVFENTVRGSMFATSATGAVTGFGANTIIFDDFINPKEAESEAERKEKIDAYSHTWSSRLNDPKNDAMVIAAQRTHTQDLTGHVLKEGGWTHVELPIIAESRAVFSFPLSKREHVREKGDILNSVRHDLTIIQRQKVSSGSRAFSAQWMCAPSSDAGNMVKRHWWKFYKETPRQMIEKMHVAVQSWDFAFKDLEASSFVMGLIGGRLGANKYIFGEIRDHMDFVETCNAVVSTSSQWPMTTFKFYEDKANGPAVKSTLGAKIAGLIAVEPLGSKEARMSAATPDIEGGNVLLPYPYNDDGSVKVGFQWVIDFIEELARFPEEPNDRGDALSQMVIKLNKIILDDPSLEQFGGTIVDQISEGSDDFPELNLNGFEEHYDDVGIL